jgi:alcohol dehydrogenase
MGKAMGLDLQGLTDKQTRKAILEFIADLKIRVGIHKNLGQRGAKLSDIPLLAEKALNDPCMVTNPRVPNQRDIEVIYEEAL